MIGLKRTIKSDLFDIARRLKEIDRDYFVVYSYVLGRYEIHNRGNKGNTYCFAVDRLDCRTLEKARRTRAERIEKLLREMDEENAVLTRKAKYETIKSIETGTEKVLSRAR